MPLFDRVASVVFGPPGAKGTLVERLRISFAVEKNATGEPNRAIVTIYNLDAATRNQIKAVEHVMLLRAGYSQAPELQPLCCAMDIMDVQHQIAHPETITTLSCGDGLNVQRNNKLKVSFKGGTSVKSIITNVADQLGVALRNLGSVDDGNYANGFAEVGPPSDILDKLSGKIGAEWSFQNGELQFSKLDRPTNTAVVVLSPETGLIGNPQKRQKAGQVIVPGLKVGWVVKSLLIPQIEPNDRVRVKTSEVDAVFRVRKIRQVGDTRGDDWYSEMEVLEYDQAA